MKIVYLSRNTQDRDARTRRLSGSPMLETSWQQTGRSTRLGKENGGQSYTPQQDQTVLGKTGTIVFFLNVGII